VATTSPAGLRAMTDAGASATGTEVKGCSGADSAAIAADRVPGVSWTANAAAARRCARIASPAAACRSDAAASRSARAAPDHAETGTSRSPVRDRAPPTIPAASAVAVTR
jgi:hypothetical protein